MRGSHRKNAVETRRKRATHTTTDIADIATIADVADAEETVVARTRIRAPAPCLLADAIRRRN